MYKVLLVEDEERIRKGLRAVFPWEKCGCTVVGEAENGQEGIERIRALRPDIVLTDISMPIVNGIDMLAATMEEYHYAAIVLSVYSDFEYARSALKLGAIDYLMKPLQNSELAAALEKAGVWLENQKRLMWRPAGGMPEVKSRVLTLPGQVNSERVRKILRYTEKHYRKKIRINDLVGELHTSAGYLNQLFKEETGYTYNDYLNRFRILKSMDLLEDDQQKIYQIADEVGIGDYKYFVSVFEKYTGMTPTNYRKEVNQAGGAESADGPEGEPENA